MLSSIEPQQSFAEEVPPIRIHVQELLLQELLQDSSMTRARLVNKLVLT
jgi:hypothetical protein